MVNSVSRTDNTSRLGKFPRTGAGAVRIPATIARTGVQLYPEQGLREYRPDAEVFAAESLASLASVPVTLGHPPAGVSPSNAREHSIGHVTDAPPEARITVDGSAEQWVRTTLIVSDGAALGTIDSGGAGAVSCGYSCDLEMTPGVTPDGEKYDAIQRNIRFNHVAILTADQKPRAGGDAKLRLDNKEDQPMKILVIDGVEYEQGSEKHVAKIQNDAAAAVKTATERADKAEAERDAAKEALKAAEAVVANVDSLVESRMSLLKRAAKFLPATYETSGKSDAQVRADAVSAKIGADKISGKSEAYIEARFDGLCDGAGDAQFHNPTKADSVSARADGLSRDDAFRAKLNAKLNPRAGEDE